MGEDYTSLDIAAALLKITMDRENESFDRTVNFEEPVREARPTQNRFPDKKFGNKYIIKDKFRRNNGENRPFGQSGNNSDDSSREARPSREGYGRPNNDRKPEGEFKPYRSAEKTRDNSSREARPPREGYSRPNNDRKPEGEFKPYRSTEKTRDNSSREARPSREGYSKPDNDRKPEGEFKPFKPSAKKKTDSSNKEGKFFDKKFSKPKSGDKKPARKFDKNK